MNIILVIGVMLLLLLLWFSQSLSSSSVVTKNELTTSKVDEPPQTTAQSYEAELKEIADLENKRYHLAVTSNMVRTHMNISSSTLLCN